MIIGSPSEIKAKLETGERVLPWLTSQESHLVFPRGAKLLAAKCRRAHLSGLIVSCCRAELERTQLTVKMMLNLTHETRQVSPQLEAGGKETIIRIHLGGNYQLTNTRDRGLSKLFPAGVVVGNLCPH